MKEVSLRRMLATAGGAGGLPTASQRGPAPPVSKPIDTRTLPALVERYLAEDDRRSAS